MLRAGRRSGNRWFGVGRDGPAEEIPVGIEGCAFDEIPCPRQRVPVGARLLFSPYLSYALWSTDGTTAGTYRVLDELMAVGPPIAAGSLAYLFRRAVEGEAVSLELWRLDVLAGRLPAAPE